MSTRITKKSKTMTKKNRAKAKGTMSRRKTSIRNKGGNVNVAMAKRK